MTNLRQVSKIAQNSCYEDHNTVMRMSDCRRVSDCWRDSVNTNRSELQETIALSLISHTLQITTARTESSQSAVSSPVIV
jgi:hypothetical protein